MQKKRKFGAMESCVSLQHTVKEVIFVKVVILSVVLID
jgi:hypothetical protein